MWPFTSNENAYNEHFCGNWGLPNEPHDFVVTDPPGYGTVLSPCNGTPARGVVTSLGEGYNVRSQWG